MFTFPHRARVARPVLAALVAATLVCVQPPRAAAQDAAAAESTPNLVTRVYPVGPLLASVAADAAAAEESRPGRTQSFYGGGGGGYGGGPGGEGRPAVTPPAPPAPAPTELLRQAVGAVAKNEVRFFGDKMIVTDTPEAQKQVADLLGAMQGNQVVTVRAVLVRANDAQVRQTTEIADGVTLLKGEPDDLPTVAQVRYSGFEGRAQHAGGGRSVPYPANVTPVVATNAVGYNVTYGTIDTGLSLDVTPTLEPGGDGVLLDVDAQYVLIDGDDAGKGDDAPAASEPTPATRPANPYGGRSLYGRVETGRSDPAPAPLAMNRMAIKTSLRAPTGRWILVGSLGSSRDGQPTDTPPMHLLLRVDAK